MELKQLRSFAEVVRCGSFTKAAENLYISQPTISTHIRTLEEELGRQLILRTTKSIQVTEKGREVYEYAANILELQERIVLACGEESRRIIHLGASTIPSAYLLPEILPEFGRLHPDTYFVIHQSDSQGVIDGLTDGMFDVGLIGMCADSEALCCQPFCQDRMVLVTPVTPRFLELQQLPEVPLETLLAEPIILREQGSGTNKSASHYLERIGVSESMLRITARINDPEAIKNLVAGGLGVSIISEKAAHNFIQEKRLLGFQLPDSGTRTLYISWRWNCELEKHIQEFRDFVTQKYQA